ncbi:MAG TPA: HlyD family secretion protein [Povalibacter sp.]|nr:HlyD family secretion protein [Povalibacter sp.]
MEASNTSANAPEASARPRLAIGKIIKWSLTAAALIAAAAIGVHYWRQAQLYVSTDNAYLNANTVQIAAQVSGPIVAIHVRDQQTVKADDALFEIDPRPYELAVQAAQAQLEIARQSTSQETAAVAAAQALVTQRAAELRNAQSNERRVRDLVARNLVSQQNAETVGTQAETAAAAVHAAQANLEKAQSALGNAGEGNAAVRAALAKLEQARLDLEHTKVTAPTSGLIANFTLRPGSTVQKELPLFTLIGDQEYWVDANFKETELDRVHPGQRAEVVMDMYRDHPFEGEVQSLSGGSGAAFSLLPAQNATGNWVKVTQRVPVRIRILSPDPAYPLRIGTTASVRVRAK